MTPRSPLDESVFAAEAGGILAPATTGNPQTILLTEAALHVLRSELAGSNGDGQSYSDQSVAVLIDPTIADPLAHDLHTRDLPRVPLKGWMFEPQKSPYVIVLQNNVRDERALNTIVRVAVEEGQGAHDTEDGQVRSVCGFLIRHEGRSNGPSRSPAVLAATIARLGWVLPPFPRAKHSVFRFWDPRITPHLPAILGAGVWLQCQQTMGTTTWLTVHGGGVLKAVRPSPQLRNDAEPLSCLRINAHQWKALVHLGWRNRIEQIATGWELPGIPDERLLNEIVSRAMGYGLESEADVLAFGQLGLTVHPLFDQHPDVARILSNPGEHSFAVTARRWNDTFIDTLRRGLWQADDRAAPQPSTRQERT